MPLSAPRPAPDPAAPRPLFLRPACEVAARNEELRADARPGETPVPLRPVGPATAPAPAIDRGPVPSPRKAPAARARMARRHRGLVLTFLLLVLAPLGGATWYLARVAEDQYGSVVGFIVRQDEGQGASELLGGITMLTGGASASDSGILYEYIQSQAMIRAVMEDVDLVGHYTARFETDPVFALWPEPTIEDLESYWQRVVRVGYDRASELIEVRVLAFDPHTATDIAGAIRSHSQTMINEINALAREDSMAYARQDLDRASAQLRAARAALTEFRTRTQILDPEADIRGRMGVLSNLQQQLAEALIALDLLAETTSAGDPRLAQAQTRIEVIRARLARERESVATGDAARPGGEDYPTLIAEFEGLMADRDHAERAYQAALSALDLAREQVQRQSRYLATYIQPTLAESAEYPRRGTIFSLLAGFLVLGWAVAALIFYSIRDRG